MSNINFIQANNNPVKYKMKIIEISKIKHMFLSIFF